MRARTLVLYMNWLTRIIGGPRRSEPVGGGARDMGYRRSQGTLCITRQNRTCQEFFIFDRLLAALLSCEISTALL
jgi:hypothetical protein